MLEGEGLGRFRTDLVSGFWVFTILVAMFGVMSNVPLAKASGTIYIRADGSIDPPDAPISTLNNATYTFTDNIASSGDGIIVERDNIMIDGDGYTLQGAGGGNGFYLFDITKVTIRRANIEGFDYSIYLGSSSYNTISGNNITNNDYGIYLSSSSANSISGNNVTANNGSGIYLSYSSNNSISGNNITGNNWDGIDLAWSSNNYNSITGNNITTNYYYGILVYWSSFYNSIHGNNITNNGIGISIHESSGSHIYHNNFLNNTRQFQSSDSYNTWDNGYPSGGNHWSDYTGIDTDGDGIGNTPYVITDYDKDHYPLVEPWPSGPCLHELNVSLKAPTTRFPTGGSTLLEATVRNDGFLKEENVTLFLIIDGNIVNSTTIAFLESGSSYTINYLWTPTVEGQGNVTAYATPMQGEVITEDNRETILVIISTNPPVQNIDTGLYYEKIQDAIDARETLDGHTIEAKAVTYFEHLEVHKSLKIVGQNRVTTTIDGTKTGTVIHMTADNVVLSNFAIQNSGDASTSGILISSCSNITIENNILSNNVHGITIQTEGEVTIEKNEISGNSESGIRIVGKSNLVIKENTIKQNKNGIVTDSSNTHSSITITDNIISYNQEDGINFYSYGQGGYYGPAGYAYINDVTISSNTISNNQRDGINLHSYGYNRASIAGYGYGYVYNVSITSNDISGNGRHGIYICGHGEGEGWAYSIITGEGWGYGYVYDVTIDFNNITSNGDDGVYVYGYGEGFGEADRFGTGYGFGYIYDLSFSSNTISSNDGNGVHIYSYGEASGSGSLSSSGYGRGYIYNVVVCSNNVSNNLIEGIYAHALGEGMGNGQGWAYVFDVAISCNIISSNIVNGLHIEASDHNTDRVYDVAASKNLISANYEKGVLIYGGINANLTHNTIFYNTHGVFYNKTANNFANHNNICDNLHGMNVTDGATVNAELNYWGDANGPYHPSLNPAGGGDPVNGDGANLDFVPFLSAPVLIPPSADFGFLPRFPFVGNTVTFDPSTSCDIDGSIVEYRWDFGDGNVTTVVGGIIVHTYIASGTYAVKLTVTDNDGLSDSIVRLVTVKYGSMITLNVDFVAITIGSNVTINGSITPTRVGVNVTISYRASYQKWTTLAEVKTDVQSCYTYAWKITYEGTYQIRVSWHGDQVTWSAESEIETLRAYARIYIRPDGSVVPPAATIKRDENSYILTTDVSFPIVVERDNIVIDGAGCTVRGTGSENGITLSGLNNVTIKNLKIDGFSYGIKLESSKNCIISGSEINNNYYGIYLDASSNNGISTNNITNNGNGINLWYSSNNSVSGNNITNYGYGVRIDHSSSNSISANTVTECNIYLYGSSSNNIFKNKITNSSSGIVIEAIGDDQSYNNTICANTIANNGLGIELFYSPVNNIISANNIIGNGYGIYLNGAYNNMIYHNNFAGNTEQVHIEVAGYANSWDNGYPSGGNYWSDYVGVDDFSGPDQDQLGSDGIGDAQYAIDGNNQDRYPLMVPIGDVTPPTSIHDYDGLWHTTDYTINLTATDDLRAIAETYYKINDGPIQNVTANGQPLITRESANNTLEYWSVDAAGNEEFPHKLLTGIKLDKTVPLIGTPSREPSENAQPDESVKVLVNVTDLISQVKNATLYYTINNGTSWEQPLLMTLNYPTSLYEATIPGQEAGTWVKYKIVAYDYAGNNATLGETEPYFVYQVVPEFSQILILPLFITTTLVAIILCRRKQKPHQKTV